MRGPRGGCLLLAASCLVASAASAQQAVLEGAVRHGDGTLGGATIVVSGTGAWETRSSPNGSFSLVVRAGELRLAVSAPGFQPSDTSITVAGGDTLRLVVTLAYRTVALAELQVTATPMARDPLRVPQSTSSLTAATLDRERGATLGATLASQPGIAERWDGPAASAPVIRGLSGERIVILHDGQRTGDLAGTAPDHMVTVDPAAANRIEIVRGPAALLYGSNAIGGVVNVLTGDLPGDLPTAVTGSVSGTLETGAPGGAVSTEAAAPLGGSGVLRLSGSYRNHGSVSTGSRNLRATESTSWGGGRRLPNTQFNATSGSVSTTWRLGGTMLSATTRTHAFAYGLPHPAGDEPVLLDGTRHQLLARVQVDEGRWRGARLETSAQLYRHQERDAAGVVLTSLEARTGSAQVVAPLRMPLSDGGAAGLSLIWRDNGVTGGVALTPPNTAASAGFFLYQELALDTRVSFPVGARVDLHDVHSRTADGFEPGLRRRYTGVSGSVGLSVLLTDGISVGGSIARAVRAPTAEELFARAGHAGTGAFEMGPPDLRGEYAHGGELVLRARGERRRAQAAAYVNRISGYIALFPTGRDTVVSDGSGGEKSYPLHVITQRDATLAGAEAWAEWEIGGGVVAGVLGDVVRGRDRDGAPLPHLPAARLGATARLERDTWSVGARGRRVLRQGPVPAGELRTDAHTLIDVHASIRHHIGGRPHELTLRADNAFDVAYRDAASRIKEFAPSPGRSIVVSYRVLF